MAAVKALVWKVRRTILPMILKAIDMSVITLPKEVQGTRTLSVLLTKVLDKHKEQMTQDVLSEPGSHSGN